MARMLARDLLIGREFGGYRIDSVISAGGMSTVYLAEHQRLGRVVALKILDPRLTDDERFRERFLRESRIAAGLNHPNVIPIHDAGEAEGLLYIAMRYVEATDLRALLRREGRLEPATALSLVRQVAAALDAAHARGLVHRDVKPGNVLLAEGGHAYLTDFGLSQQATPSSWPTAAGAFVGTVDYVAPEQVEGEGVGPSADIYSLACVLYECLTGGPPYERESDLAVLWAHLDEAPPAISARRSELPSAFDAVIERGLAKRPEERYRRCGEFIEAATAALGRRPVGAELPRELDVVVAPLTGRSSELEVLRAAWREACEGHGRIVLLEGGRGMGKTRLAAELAREVHAEGGRVRYARLVNSAPQGRAVLEALGASEPTLLVLDDLDAAESGFLKDVADGASSVGDRPLLVLAAYRGAASSPALEGMIERVGPARLALEGLRLEEIAELAEFYSPQARERFPAATVLAASEGVPERVHQLVSEWARSEASNRVAEAAGRAVADRSSLRSSEATLESTIGELQRVRERTRLAPPRGQEIGEPATSPFKGLAPFESADAEYYFGRERLVTEMVARLLGNTLLGVVGPSGNGKSSAIRAGLLPALKSGLLPGSERWRRVLVRPGNHPLRSLADAVGVAREGSSKGAAAAIVDVLDEDEHILLVVDQFEEIFTASSDEAERAAFVDALTVAARDARGRATIVVGLRADFYGRCADYGHLAELLAANHVLVGPMQADELRRAIELPARRVGDQTEAALVDALVADVVDEPGGLPLLSTTLLELWQRREGRTLRIESYEEIGGVRGAVARLAEEAYARLNEQQQAVARRILLRLAAGREGEAAVRRQVPLAELDVEANEDIARVLAILTESRLLTASDGTVEVAHEALLGEWPRLRAWLEEDVQGRRLHHHLIQAASEWDEGGRDEAEFYRGARLAAALEWTAEHQIELNQLEREFLAESREASERATMQIRRTNRRLRIFLALAAVLLAGALVGGAVALVQRSRAREAEANARQAALAADAQRLGAQAVVDPSLDRSLLLARAGVSLTDSVETRSSLLGALLRSPAAIRQARGGGARLQSMAIDPSGQLLAAGSDHGVWTADVVLFDAKTLKETRRQTILGSPYALAFSPDGKTLAVGGAGEEGPFLELVDPQTGRVRDRQSTEKPIRWLSYSRDGSTLVANESKTVDGRGEIVLRNAKTGERVGRSRTGSYGNAVFTHDSSALLTSTSADGTALLDATTLEPKRVWKDVRGWTAVSPDDRIAAVGAPDGSLTFLDLVTGKEVRARGRHDERIRAMAFTRDGRRLVTAGDDQIAIVWDVASEAPLETFRAHTGAIHGLALSPDGKTAFTASADGSIIAWDLDGSRRLGRPFTFAETDEQMASLTSDVSLDGRLFATNEPRGRFAFWDTAALGQVGPSIKVAPRGSLVSELRFSPDGRTLATATTAGGLTVWDVAARNVVAGPTRVSGSGEPLTSLAFSPDGGLLAALTADGRTGIFDARTLAPRGKTLASGVGGADLAFSPDGQRVAVAGEGGIVLWDVVRRRKLTSFPGLRGSSIDFSPDGRLLAAGTSDGTVALFDVGTGRQVGAIRAHEQVVLSLDFNPDGTVLVTSGGEGTVFLWDVASRSKIGSALAKFPGVSIATFTPTGRHVLAVADIGRGVIWDVRVEAWKQHACAVAGRELSPAEWRDFIGNRPYEPVCTGRNHPPGRFVSAGQSTSAFEDVPCPPDVLSGIANEVVCGYLTVPENRAESDDRTIRIFVTRIQAPSGNPEPDPIFMPGANLAFTPNYDGLAPAAERLNRELIIMDERGLGHSRPALSCPEVMHLSDPAAGIVLGTPSTRVRFLEAVQACHDRLLSRGTDLGSYNLAESAADAEDLRTALGIEEWNLITVGTASAISFEIMRRYPGHIRAVVLDSPEAPHVDLFTEAILGTRYVLEEIAKACAADRACAARFPDVRGAWAEMLQRLHQNPSHVSTRRGVRVVVDDSLTVRVTREGLAYSHAAGTYPRTLSRIRESGRRPVDPRAAGWRETPLFTNGYAVLFDDPLDFSSGLFYSIVCHDELPFVDTAALAEAAEGDPWYVEAYAHSVYSEVCERWGIGKAAANIHQPVRTDIPTLILVGRFDPFAPLPLIQEAAATLSNSWIVTAPNWAHNVLGSECGPPTRNAWIDAPTSPPNTSCLSRLPEFEFDLGR
jgi:WD40 repeat protein/pimeloyl-ACP methyl ester carboxylesterase